MNTHTHCQHLVSCSQQVISHLVQVGGPACVDEAQHLFEDIWLHVIYLHAILNERRKQQRKVDTDEIKDGSGCFEFQN